MSQIKLSTENILPKTPQSSRISTSSAYSSQANSLQFNEHEASTYNFQDIHGNYAKRRYKNVESKVGRYIASVRAEERKRRAAKKLLRSSSAPLTLTMPEEPNSEALHKGLSLSLHESTTNYVDSEASSNKVANHHETSDNAINGNNFVDNQTYAQLIFEKEHLEALLDDKRTECLRHKRNVDFLRIELSNCQDELKHIKAQFSSTNLRYSTGYVGYSFATRPNYSLELLNMPHVFTKATQTDAIEILDTPKRISTKENVLRLRTHTNSFNQKIEKSEQHRFVFHEENNNSIYQTAPNKLLVTPASNSPAASIKSPSLHAEFIYYDRDYTTIQNNTSDSSVGEDLQVNANQKSCQRSSSFRQRFSRFFGRCIRCDDSNQTSVANGVASNEQNIEIEQLQKSQDAASTQKQQRDY